MFDKTNTIQIHRIHVFDLRHQSQIYKLYTHKSNYKAICKDRTQQDRKQLRNRRRNQRSNNSIYNPCVHEDNWERNKLRSERRIGLIGGVGAERPQSFDGCGSQDKLIKHCCTERSHKRPHPENPLFTINLPQSKKPNNQTRKGDDGLIKFQLMEL